MALTWSEVIGLGWRALACWLWLDGRLWGREEEGGRKEGRGEGEGLLGGLQAKKCY